MATCEVRWIDSKGKRTPDNNQAVYKGRTKAYRFYRDDGSFIDIPVSEWFFICEEHGKRLSSLYNWEWERVEEYPTYMAL